MDRAALEAEIGRLQDHFNEVLLPELLLSDAGRYALVRDYALVATFPSADEAYIYSVHHFGLDQPIVIAKIEPLTTLPDNLTWDFGLMF